MILVLRKRVGSAVESGWWLASSVVVVLVFSNSSVTSVGAGSGVCHAGGIVAVEWELANVRSADLGSTVTWGWFNIIQTL